MSDDKPVNRRSFFRESLRGLLRPLASTVAPIERAVHQLGNLEWAATPKMPPAPAVPRKTSLPLWLRPPGATGESEFTQTCQHSGQCVRVCPAQCIRLDPDKAGGVPYIVADEMPCVVCDGLLCMQKCPSGALLPTPLVDIDMGTARWRHEICLRNSGENCTICVDHCPLGTAAIQLRDGDIHVVEDGCIGCGVCQHDCPTSPKSIVVAPRES
jgi:ferredoxin-type protein NapG